MGPSRRELIAGSGAIAAGVGILGTAVEPAHGDILRAGQAGCSGPVVEKFGVAIKTASVVGAAMHNGKVYVTTRGQNPPLLAELDIATLKVTRTVPLKRGDGAWGVTVVGDQVYVGAYPFPDLYRFDIPSGKLSLVKTLGAEGTIIFCLTTTPNGKVCAGTYPDCGVHGYDPRNGSGWKWLGAASGEQYVRAIAADEKYIYAGTMSAGKLIRFTRADGAKRDITPGKYGGAAVMMVRNGRVISSMGRHVVDVATDGSGVQAIQIPAGEGQIDALTMTPDGTLFCVGRPTGTVYQRSGRTLKAIAAPAVADEHRGVFALDNKTLCGVAGSGIVWRLDLTTRKAKTVDLTKTTAAGAGIAQSIAYGPTGEVHVGANSAIWTHRPAKKESIRAKVNGEPKAMRVVDGLVYAAIYPSGELMSLRPDTGKVTSYGRIGNGQARPHDLEYLADQNLLLIASGPSYGPVKGALTILDRADHTLKVYHDVVPNQSVVAVSVENSIAYLAGDTFAIGSDPVAKNATVVAFDLAKRKVLWEKTPFAGYQSLQHIAVANGILYGLYKRPGGTWFAMDIATQKVISSGKLSSYGQLTVHRGQVFASVHRGSIYRIGPNLATAKLMIGNLGESWFTPPQLAFESSTSWHAWGLADRQLAKLRLDPSCAR